MVANAEAMVLASYWRGNRDGCGAAVGEDGRTCPMAAPKSSPKGAMVTAPGGARPGDFLDPAGFRRGDQLLGMGPVQSPRTVGISRHVFHPISGMKRAFVSCRPPSGSKRLTGP